MKTSVKIALAVVLFIALGGILGGLYLFNKQHADLQKLKPDFVIAAADLQKAFEDNEADAAAKFVNKIIEVTGTVESVKTGEGGVTNVTIKTGSDLSAVICTLVPNADASKLVSGNETTIRGECSGFLMDVLLNNCVIIK